MFFFEFYGRYWGLIKLSDGFKCLVGDKGKLEIRFMFVCFLNLRVVFKCFFVILMWIRFGFGEICKGLSELFERLR